MRLAFLVILLSVGLVACKKSKEEEKSIAKLLVGSWKLESMLNKTTGVSQTYPPAFRTTVFTFSDSSRFAYIAPCNGGGGTYQIDELGGFSIDNHLFMSISCSQAENDLENLIISAFSNTYNLKIADNKLLMRSTNLFQDMTLVRE